MQAQKPAPGIVAPILIGMAVFVLMIVLVFFSGPAIGNVFVSDVQADILLPQEQHDLDAARNQVRQSSAIVGNDILLGFGAGLIGLTSLLLAGYYMHRSSRVVNGVLLISALCGGVMLFIVYTTIQIMITAGNIGVYPLTGNPWDKDLMINTVLIFVRGIYPVSIMALVSGTFLIVATVAVFWRHRRFKASSVAIDSAGYPTMEI